MAFVFVIPFYTQGQNCPFSSWQSRNFSIYPKNVKMAPSFYISLRTAFPPGISGMSVPQPALHYKTRGRQRRTNAARHVLFHAGASARRNNAAFISRHVPDRHDVSPSFADLPTVSFHSGPAVAGANGDTSGSMTGRDPARRSFCLSQNRKSPPCVCPGRPLSDPPGRTLILPLLHTFYTHPVYPLIPSPEFNFLLGNAVRICRTQRSVIVS